MYFATGLYAYREYRERNSDYDLLDQSAEAFKDGLEFYPRDALLQFYHALMLLEQASVVDKRKAGPPSTTEQPHRDGYADADLLTKREALIQGALVNLETYQLRVKESANLDGLTDWLFLWSEYNRAAAEVHRLSPAGYVAARGILSPYLEEAGFDERLEEQAPHATQDMLRVSFAALRPDSETLMTRLASWWNVVRQRKDALPKESSRTLKLMEWLREHQGEGEYMALLLQMESLVTLTRARPMREPDSLRHLAVRESAEPLDLRYEDLGRLNTRLDEFAKTLETQLVRKSVSDDAIRDLTSDLWSQRGHLICARALQAAGLHPQIIRKLWPNLERPLDNAAAFKWLALQAAPVMQSHLEEAANMFRKALSFQPRWLPAQRNLDEVQDVLRDIERQKRGDVPAT